MIGSQRAVNIRPDGFTLVELVGVIVIAGIVLAVAVPRFFSAHTFASRGYADTASAFLRYSQKLAIARHATLHVHISSSGLTLCAAAASPCASLVPGPDGQTPFQALVPNDVSLNGSIASLSFDAQGRPGSAATLTITGDSTRTLTVEAETGYVH